MLVKLLDHARRVTLRHVTAMNTRALQAAGTSMPPIGVPVN